LARSSSSAWRPARLQPALTLAPCCLNVGDWEPEEEEAGEHLHPGGLVELLGGLGVLGQEVQGGLGEQQEPVGVQGGLEEEQVLLGKSAAVAVGGHYTGAVGGPVAVQPRCSGHWAQGFRCIGSGGRLTRYTGRWGRTADLVLGGEWGALSWCDGVRVGLQQESEVPGGPELVVVVAVVVVGAGTCLGLSDAVGGGARSRVLRTFALRGGACRTGRSLSSAGIARTSPPLLTVAGPHTLHRCRLS